MRAGKRARTYLPALAVLERADESIGPLVIEGLTDAAHPAGSTPRSPTRSTRSSDAGHPVALHARRGMLAGGPVTYVHHAPPVTPTVPGIRVGEETVRRRRPARNIDLICTRAGY